MFQLTCDCSIIQICTSQASCRSINLALTQLAYTTLSEHTYSLVANNLTQFIMEQKISDCIITISDKEFDYIDSWFEEHPNGASNNFPEWVWDEEELKNDMPF